MTAGSYPASTAFPEARKNSIERRRCMSSMRLPSGSATNAIRTPASGDGPGGMTGRAPRATARWIPGVQIGNVERHVPVSLAQGRLTGCGRLDAGPGTGPVPQLEAVAERRVDEHLDAQVDRADPERELGHQPEYVAEPRDGRGQVGDREPDVVQPGDDGILSQPWAFSPAGSQVR